MALEEDESSVDSSTDTSFELFDDSSLSSNPFDVLVNDVVNEFLRELRELDSDEFATDELTDLDTAFLGGSYGSSHGSFDEDMLADDELLEVLDQMVSSPEASTPDLLRYPDESFVAPFVEDLEHAVRDSINAFQVDDAGMALQ